MATIKYFGTNTIEAGHYIWDVSEYSISNRSIDFSNIPFNPENLIDTGTPFGEVRMHYIDNYTIIAVSGSCRDKRPGSKSVFWINEVILFYQFKDKILNTKPLKEIIENMPFEIKWQD